MNTHRRLMFWMLPSLLPLRSLVLSLLVVGTSCKPDAPTHSEAPAELKPAAAAASPPPTPAAREAVNVSLFSWPGYGFWFVAKELDLAPTLDLQIQIIEDPVQSYTLMAAGKLDVISSTFEYGPIAAETKNPARIVTLANLSFGTDKLVLAPSAQGPADLVGKSVAVAQGGLSQIYMGIWLTDNGVDFGKVTFANLIMDDAAAAMVSGKVAAAELWEPFGSKVLSTLKGSRVVAQSNEPAWLNAGIGAVMIRSQRLLQTDAILACILTIGLLGLLSDLAFAGISRLAFPYLRRESTRR